MFRIVCTGGPATGKSTVIHLLESVHSKKVIPEVARNLIKFFQEHEPEKLPWVNNAFFQPCVETKLLEDYVNNEYGVYDRGLVDQIAYRNYFKLEVPDSLVRKCLKYRYDKVFYFPFWEEIYKQDDERVETKEQAQTQDYLLRQAYDEMGYKVIEVPKTTVRERLNFVLDNAFNV